MKKFEVVMPEYGEIEFFASEYQLDDGDLVFRITEGEAGDPMEIGRIRAGCWAAVFMVAEGDPEDANASADGEEDPDEDQAEEEDEDDEEEEDQDDEDEQEG